MRPVLKRIFNSNLLELNFTRLLGVANSFPAIGDVCCRTSKWSRIDCYCITSICCFDWCLCLHCCQQRLYRGGTEFKWPTCGLTGKTAEPWSKPVRACACKHADSVASSLAFLGNRCETMDQCKGREDVYHPTVCLCVRSMPSDDIKLPIWEVTDWLLRGNATRPSLLRQPQWLPAVPWKSIVTFHSEVSHWRRHWVLRLP